MIVRQWRKPAQKYLFVSNQNKKTAIPKDSGYIKLNAKNKPAGITRPVN